MVYNDFAYISRYFNRALHNPSNNTKIASLVVDSDQLYPLLISTGFLKYPLELKKNFSYNWKKNSVSLYWNVFSVLTEILFQFYTYNWKKISVITEKKYSWFITEFLSKFEIIAEMEISKNQWRSTGGWGALPAVAPLIFHNQANKARN